MLDTFAYMLRNKLVDSVLSVILMALLILVKNLALHM